MSRPTQRRPPPSDRSLWEFRDSLEFHRRARTRADGKTKEWTSQELAYQTGVKERTVNRWFLGTQPQPAAFERLLTFLFGSSPAHAGDVNEMRALYKLLAAPTLITQMSARASSSIPEMGSLTPEALDRLLVDDRFVFEEISYGEGFKIESISHLKLKYLPGETELISEEGHIRTVSSVLLDIYAEPSEAYANNKDIFVPHSFTVSGRRRHNHVVIQIYIWTDKPYLQGLDDTAGSSFNVDCTLCRPGLAAFYDEITGKRYYEPWEGHGCAGALVAVAISNHEPIYRSAYVLLVRKGIRYPMDNFCSKDGRPFASDVNNITNSRFVFQSRDTRGNTTDIFVCDYNGDRMCNLTDNAAWESLTHDGTGEELGWTDDGRIEYFSNARGFVEKSSSRTACRPLVSSDE